MRQRVNLKIGKTFLIDGPATVQVISGMVNVMGAVFAEGSIIKVKRFRRASLYAEHSEVSLVVEGGNYRFVEGSTIPNGWIEVAEETAGEDTRLIAVVGEVDSGKTSLATFLANYYLNLHGEVGIVDGDLGQNDLSIPGTVSAGVTNKGLSDLSRVKPEIVEFIGLTTPETGTKELNEAIASVVRRLFERGIGKIVLNTDGWVESRGIRHKAELMKMVKPSFIISLLDRDQAPMFAMELEPSMKIIQVEKSPYVMRRTKRHRRSLRMQNYRRHFARSKPVKMGIKETAFVNHPFLNGKPAKVPEGLGEKFSIMEAKLYMDTTYLKVRESLEEPMIIKANGKSIVILEEYWEKGLLVGLSRDGKMWGVGIIDSFTGNEVVVKTQLTAGFNLIKLGEIKLDVAFNERNFYWKPRD